MCRNIKTLYNFEPPASKEEINLASLQFVRKISGFKSPSKQNTKAFNEALEEISKASEKLLKSLQTNSPTKNREVEASKKQAINAKRYQMNQDTSKSN